MEFLHRLQSWQQQKIKSIDFASWTRSLQAKLFLLIRQIKSIGHSDVLDEYERRKLRIFNLLNFFQLLTGILVPLAGILTISSLPSAGWILASCPALVSLTVLLLVRQQQYRTAYLFYFICYPVFTCIIYINGINLGVELSFVLYGILSVFFLQEIGYMVFSIGLSMVSYFILSILLKDYQYQLKSISIFAYLFNQVLAIAYIFYGLYLIKKENSDHHASIVEQKAELSHQAGLLKQQAGELAELNAMNHKLFSIISHDLKSPMYALRSFFINAKEMRLPAREIRAMLPDVINDLNYTTGLMENLLHWAKSQMESNGVRPQQFDMHDVVSQSIRLLRIQADAKDITINYQSSVPIFTWADKDMTNLVVRNLLSNAIKFTPTGGTINVGLNQLDSFAEVFIQDSGVGITRETMSKINENNFYSTNGTASETGTGLGLMLCKEFLARNQGHLMIESEPGKGSTFSFTLPQPG